MENKYYDLIVSLIKEHKKYPGLENILEDIANEVLLKSQNVLNSIDDETVIIDYLNKTISCSILTVSKRMGYKKRNSSTLPQATNIVAERNTTNYIMEEQVSEELETLLFEQESFEFEEEKNIDIEIEDNVDNVEEIENHTVDISLVDKMINGVDTTVDVVEEVPMEEETSTTIDLIETTEDSEINLLEENNYFEDEKVETELLESEPIDLNEDNENLFIDDTFTKTTLEIEDNFVLEEEPAEIEVQENEEDTFVETSVSENNLAFPVFNNIEIDKAEYEPLNTEYLISTLKDIAIAYPNENIFKICDLKFKQKMSIKNISENLDISEEIVLNTLNKIITEVKV